MDSHVVPVSSPIDVLVPLLAQVGIGKILSVGIFLLFALWCIYSVIAAYHLFRYGHRVGVTLPAVLTHVIVSFFLTLFAISGLAP